MNLKKHVWTFYQNKMVFTNSCFLFIHVATDKPLLSSQSVVRGKMTFESPNMKFWDRKILALKGMWLLNTGDYVLTQV